jgi:hypothetical protein
MRFVNLSATSERVGKGHRKRLILRKDAAGQSAALPVLAFGDADTGFFQSSDDVLELTTAGVSRMKWDASGITTVSGNLVVSGTTTTIGSTTLTVDDKNIELGSVATPSDTTADGGGITLKGATDKTFNWINSTDAWTSSEHINLASGKTFQLNGTSITSTAAELNLLSSVPGLVQADLTKLAAITSSAAELNYTDGVTSAIQTQLTARLPLTGGAMTGAITTNSTFDGVDIAARDAVLTSTTTTAGAALPKAGGAMTGNITSASDLSLDVEGDITLTALSDIIHQSTSTNSTAGHHIFKSYNTEIMRIDGSQNRVGIGDSAPNDKLQVAGTITSQHNIVSDEVYNLFSARSSRTNNDYGGVDKQYMQMNLVTPGGTNTPGEGNAHAYGDLRFAFVDGADTTFHDRVTFRYNGNVGIRTVQPHAVLAIRGQNENTGSSTHGAEEPITMLRGSNGSTVQEWVHGSRATVSPSHTTMYSWYKLFSPGGYSSAGTPGAWEIHCHIGGGHASSGMVQKFTLLQSNTHSGVADHGGANYSLVNRYCTMGATGGGAYGAGLTVTFWYLSSGAGNNGATFFVRAQHYAREPQMTFYAKYIGGTGAGIGNHEQSFSFLGTQDNNNHQPSNITSIGITTVH